MEELPTVLCAKCDIDELCDGDLIVGEVLELLFSSAAAPVYLVKMKAGQYLNVHTGKGLCFSHNLQFCSGKPVTTSEGTCLGLLRGINALIPREELLSLSKIFIGRYYKQSVTRSLWSLYEQARGLAMVAKENTTCVQLQDEAKELGINALTLLCVANAASNSVYSK